MKNFDLVMWDWAGTLLINKELNPNLSLEVFNYNKHAIVSNYENKQVLIEWCKKVGISDFFSTENITCQEDGVKKPNPLMYSKLCAQMNFDRKPKRIIFIGDSVVDRLFAENIGAEFLFINDFNVDFFT